MSVQVQHRRDSNTNLEANTPAAGELWWDTTKNELTMGNGALAGGIRMQKKNIREITAPTQIAANTNDYSPANLKHAAVLRLTTDASRNLTGLVPLTVTDSTDGREITLYNAGSFNLVVQDQNTASSAANRFDLGGSDLTLAPKQSITLRYSNTITRWEIVEGTFGQAIADGAVSARKLATSALGAFCGMINGTFGVASASNALTIGVKTLTGADPSPTDPVYLVFRDVTAANGDFVVRTLTSFLNFTISAGSSLGFTTSVPGKFWVVALDNAGSVQLGIINCLSGTDVFPLAGFGVISTVAEGGAGAADSAQVMYSGSAMTSKPYAVLGYAAYETGLATPGNWGVPPRMQLYGPGVPLPGTVIGRARQDQFVVLTGTTQIPLDNTLPQSTEGDQYLSKAYTPSSACHLLAARSRTVGSSSLNSNSIIAAMFRDSGANAIAANAFTVVGTAGGLMSLDLDTKLLFGSSVSTTLKVRAGLNTAGTFTLNGSAGAALLGGSCNSFLEIKEIAT